MAFIDTHKLPIIELKPGWHGRYFNSPSMTFGHYVFDPGATIPVHNHPEEEVWQVIEGQLELTIGEEIQTARAGHVGIVPSDMPHAVRAITRGQAIVVDHPARAGVAEAAAAR